MATKVGAAEVWAIQVGGLVDPYLLPPMDEMGCREFLAFPSRDEALRGIERQRAKGFLPDSLLIDAVRLK